MSWTLDRKRAEWFADWNPEFRAGDGYVLAGQVQRSFVWAYINDREEQEIVVDPVDVKFVGAEPHPA